jgi:hypothetical protein
MKTLRFVLLLVALALPLHHSRAQSKIQEKPKLDVPVKIHTVFSEFDGDKKISSMPYSFTAVTDEKTGGYYTTSLRTGVRIPVNTGVAEQKTSYMDVGSNIDFGIRLDDEDRYHLYMVFERSALHSGAGESEDKSQNLRPAGQLPIVRQFKVSDTMILRDGQTSESVASTDPLNGHSLRISVTINVVK